MRSAVYVIAGVVGMLIGFLVIGPQRWWRYRHDPTPRVHLATIITETGKKLVITRKAGPPPPMTMQAQDVTVPVYQQRRLLYVITAEQAYRRGNTPVRFIKPRVTQYNEQGQVVNVATADNGELQPVKGDAGYSLDSLKLWGNLRFEAYRLQEQVDAYRNTAGRTGR